jgi:hypothetical protein
MSSGPFIHEDHCRYQDHQPEWQADAPMGVERRQCMCGAESRSLAVARLDPAGRVLSRRGRRLCISPAVRPSPMR